MTFTLKALMVFSGTAILDYVWAYYTRAITDNRAVAACTYAGVLEILIALKTLGYVTDYRLVAFAIAGAMVGTFFAMKRGK